MPVILWLLALFTSPPSTAPVHFEQQTIAVGKGPRAIAVADVNHDDKADILVTNSVDETITVLLSDGRGHFTPSHGSPFPAGHEPNDIGLGDFNGDGNLDIVVPNHQSPYLTVLLGDGNGSFKMLPAQDVHSYPHPHGVAVGGFNQDKRLDVAIDSWGHNQIEVLLGNGDGTFATPGRFFDVGKRPYQRLRAADFNHDGHLDIVTTNLDEDTVSVLLGDGKGSFHSAAGSPFAAGAKPWAVVINDFNGDRNADLAVIPYDRDVSGPDQIAVTVLLGDGKGGFRPSPSLKLSGCVGSNGLSSGDVNGDHMPDLVVTCGQSGTMFVFLGRKSGFTSPLIVQPIKKGWGLVAVGDLDGDEKAEIVTANSNDNSITIYWSR